MGQSSSHRYFSLVRQELPGQVLAPTAAYAQIPSAGLHVMEVLPNCKRHEICSHFPFSDTRMTANWSSPIVSRMVRCLDKGPLHGKFSGDGLRSGTSSSLLSGVEWKEIAADASCTPLRANHSCFCQGHFCVFFCFCEIDLEEQILSTKLARTCYSDRIQLN